MCGIVGYLDKSGDERAAVGRVIQQMLEALGCRGPDSAGVALFSSQQTGCQVLRIKLGEHGSFAEKGRRIAEGIQHIAPVQDATTTAEYLRLVVDYNDDPRKLEHYIESLDDDVEVVSM